jgi:hypothetical protein
MLEGREMHTDRSSSRRLPTVAFTTGLTLVALTLVSLAFTQTAPAAPTPLPAFEVAGGAGDQKYPGVGRYGGSYFFAWTDENGTHMGDLAGRQAWGTPPDFWSDPPLDLATPYTVSDGSTYANSLGAVGGEYVVWSAKGGPALENSYDIWGRSWRGVTVGGPATLPLFNVSDDQHTQMAPDFDVGLKAGGIPSARWLAVWGDPRSDRGDDVWGAVIDGTTGATGPEFPVFRYKGTQWFPRVSGPRVVWEDRRSFKNPDIRGGVVNLATRKVTVVKVKVARGQQTLPDIFRKTVVYVQPLKSRTHVYKMTWGKPRSSRPIDRSATVQTFPRIDGAWIVFQRRVSEGDWDVWAYNTVTRKKLLVAGGTADQQRATVNGNVVVWQEKVGSGDWDVRAACLPWKSVITANGTTRLYTRSLSPKLAVSARSNADKVRSFRLSYVYDRSSWTDWTAYDPAKAVNPAGTYTLPDADGPYGVWAEFDDYCSNHSQLAYVDIFLDRKGPVTEAVAPATVKRGGTARLKYRIMDQAWTATARTTIKIRTKGGALVKTLTLGMKPAGELFLAPLNTAKFTCSLPRGSYTWTVYAIDLAGNVQSAAGQDSLTVD